MKLRMYLFGIYPKESNSQKKTNMATLAGMVAGVLLGLGGAGDAGGAVIMSTAAAGQAFSLAYSREDEAEADQVGLKYLSRAGYNAKGLLVVMKKMRGKEWFDSSIIPTYTRPLFLGASIWALFANGTSFVDEVNFAEPTKHVPPSLFPAAYAMIRSSGERCLRFCVLLFIPQAPCFNLYVAISNAEGLHNDDLCESTAIKR
jgi:hypothetical protein